MELEIRISKHTKERHIILNDVSNPKNLSSYVLFKDHLRHLDVDYLESQKDLIVYFRFRKKFLKKQLKEKGCLECTYCHRKDLIIGHTDLEHSNLNNKITNLATIDHIHPVSRGGALYDPKNCTVACKTCNKKKGNKLLIEM